MNENTRVGAGGRNRTRDPLITSQVLYQLSYTGQINLNYPSLLGLWQAIRLFFSLDM